MNARWTLLCLVGLSGVANSADFQTDVLPIFQQRCFRCHGEGEDKGNFSLDPENISRHISTSRQINPGNAERSVLMELVRTDDLDQRMPPKGQALNPAQIAILTEWIDDGAELGAMETTAEDGESTTDEPEGPQPLTGTFTNREGTAIQATALRIDGANVVLRLADGRELPYPIANLSDETQAQLKAWANPAAE